MVVLAGSACFAIAAAFLPYERFDLQLLVLVGLTVGFGSRVSVQIPQLKSHISVSDTFIFLALLVYGGEVAIVLSAIEAVFSSWRFCTKKLTIAFNGAAFAISTTCVVSVLKSLGLATEGQLHGYDGSFSDFVIALSAIALTQFFANTVLASVHDSLKDAIPYWETWKDKYLWAFMTYFIGAAGAGALVQLSNNVGIGVTLAVFPVILLVYLTYKMYLSNVEMSILQAETAREYASVLEDRTNALRESEERFRSAFNYAPIGMALVSPKGRWLKVNHALCDILGYDVEELLASDFQSMIIAEDLFVTLSNIQALVFGSVPNCQLEQRYRHKSGQTVWVSLSVSSGGKLESEKANLIFQIQDITARKLAEKELQHAATHDMLTGLPNRAFFMARLSEALSRTHKEPGQKASVLFIDLDHFKYVNDSFGHIVGDRLLIAISNRIRDCMRPSDMVARLGGDEFTILVEGEHEELEVTAIAERIREQFCEPYEISGNTIHSSASIGILHASESHSTAEEMMRDADTAMYMAKRAGKARHEVFNESMLYVAREQ